MRTWETRLVALTVLLGLTVILYGYVPHIAPSITHLMPTISLPTAAPKRDSPPPVPKTNQWRASPTLVPDEWSASPTLALNSSTTGQAGYAGVWSGKIWVWQDASASRGTLIHVRAFVSDDKTGSWTAHVPDIGPTLGARVPGAVQEPIIVELLGGGGVRFAERSRETQIEGFIKGDVFFGTTVIQEGQRRGRGAFRFDRQLPVTAPARTE